MYFSDVQVRLIILYAMRCYKTAMSEDNISEIIVWQDILDYFTAMNCVYELEEMGMVKPTVIDNVKKFDITGKGMQSVNLFKNKIPLSVRDKIYDKCYDLRERMARGREIAADIVPIDEKRFMARCGIYEHRIPLLEVNIFAGSRKHAEGIAKRFEKEASRVYKIILENIIEEW